MFKMLMLVSSICGLIGRRFKLLDTYFSRKAYKYSVKLCFENDVCLNNSLSSYFAETLKGKRLVDFATGKIALEDCRSNNSNQRQLKILSG